MDVLSLEHNFGREIETSIQQLFTFFCNNINLGQWQLAKACLKQLYLNKKSFKFDLDEIIHDIVANPQVYTNGSYSIRSPYQLALLLYEYGLECGNIKQNDDKLYDRTILKCIVYSSFDEELSDQLGIKTDENGTCKESNAQTVINELMIHLENELFDAKQDSLNSSSQSADCIELSLSTFECLKCLLLRNAIKARALFEIAIKYNANFEHSFLKIHLSAINKVLDDLDYSYEETLNANSSKSPFDMLCQLLNTLCIYKLDFLSSPSNKKENLKCESLALIQRCFKEISCKMTSLWQDDLNQLDARFRSIYSSLLFDLDDENVDRINLLNMFIKIHYEIERQITMANMHDHELFPVMSLIKQYATMSKSDPSYVWRRLFMFCFMENKILLRSIIDECVGLIGKNQFDNLSQMFSVKELQNLKPIVLLIGISKCQDIQAAKRLIGALCWSTDKGTLIDKIGNLLKTHLDFIAWFQQIAKSNRKKEALNYNELIKLLHKQLPLNILSQQLDLSQLDHSEMNKMLRNTLLDKETSQKTKWVRFVDEVNEKISQTQEVCLAIYNGYYCINQILELVLYCCEHLNKRLFVNANAQKCVANSNRTTPIDSQALDCGTNGDVQIDYDLNVLAKLNEIKAILNQIVPFNYRLEIFENIYSLIYLSCNDLKEDEEREDMDSENTNNQDSMNKSNESNDDGTKRSDLSDLNASKELYELFNQESTTTTTTTTNDSKRMSNIEHDFSIYNNNASSNRKSLESATNQSSKSTLASCYGSGSQSSRRRRNLSSTCDDNNKLNVYYRNAGGGGIFLVNDFMCRDLLMLLKELTQSLFGLVNASHGTSSTTKPSTPLTQLKQVNNETNNNMLNCSIANTNELNKRLSKLQELVNETLWRFQIVKSNDIQMEYGKVNKIYVNSQSENEKQEILIYELLKTRKRAESSSVSMGELGKKISEKETSVQMRPNSISFTNSLKRRSFESQRSLSLIYPLNKNKYSNCIIMKLLADVETLSAYCLKQSKLNEANQLLKMYSSKACKSSFEFRQLAFRTIYQETQAKLAELSTSYAEHQDEKGFVKLNMQSLNLAKLCESLLGFERDNELMQAIFLTDLLVCSRVNLNLTCEVVNYARIKLNVHLRKERDHVEKNEPCSQHGTDLNRFELELSRKLLAFYELVQSICNRFDHTDSSVLNDFMFKYDGIDFNLMSQSDDAKHTSEHVERAIEKFESFKLKLHIELNSLMEKFQSEQQQQQHVTYSNIIDLINETNNLVNSQDFDSKSANTNINANNNTNEQEHAQNDLFLNSIEQLIYKSNSKPADETQTSSNYLLSFFEYCKTLFEYFKEKSVEKSATKEGQASSSSSSSSLFVSYFTILESSPAALICKLLFDDSIRPHLLEPLTQKLNLNLTAIILHNSCPRLKLNYNKQQVGVDKESAESNSVDRNMILNQAVEKSVLKSNINVYNASFYCTVLNESEIACCSRKNPDKFMRELLSKLLKFIRLHLTSKQVADSDTSSFRTSSAAKSEKKSSSSLIDLKYAQELNKDIEFKSILNESQQLQHINLHALKSDNEKLAFFINLFNFLSIHAHLYLASIVAHRPGNEASANRLFKNRTEKLLFEQRMCYKVGQMGCVSLYELKHQILFRHYLKCDFWDGGGESTSREEPLYKYAFYQVDRTAEPVWSHFMPSERVCCDYRVLFALINCTESDPPICAYNSTSLLDDQLSMQMKFFLNNSIHADLCNDLLYMPSIVVNNNELFIRQPDNHKSNLNASAMSADLSASSDSYSLIKFLVDHVNGELRQQLEGLLQLDTGVDEHIDQYGRKELPFPIVKLVESADFSLQIDANNETQNVWYKKQIESIRANKETNEPLRDDDLKPVTQCLNDDCLEYIEKNSPLISNSLSFLFDTKAQLEFFELISCANESPDESIDAHNSLNRFIKLYVPLDFMNHLDMHTKLNLIAQFLHTNKTDESKIELIINLANYYAEKQEWHLVMSLLNTCTQDNEELNELNKFKADTLFDMDLQTSQQMSNESNVKFGQKDLINLYDHACICQAYQEAKTNEKSYMHLFKMKNFLRQVRAMFGLMHLWSIDACIELIEYCLSKSKSFENSLNNMELFNEFVECHKQLVGILHEKKVEFDSYKELTKCARQTLEKYYEHQQIQDEAGFKDSRETIDLNKMKSICKKCLTWQYAKNQLESLADNDDTNELIMDLFLLNDQFHTAKCLIRKLNLDSKLKFKLDFGHLKHRLLNLNVSSSIIVIDFESILKECISFDESDNYLFNVCSKLLGELKYLNELNNQVLICLCEFLIKNYLRLLSEPQLRELRVIQLTAKIFQLLVQNKLDIQFDVYKRHHSNPLLIVEQLLMNSHIELCSHALKLCRESIIGDEFQNEINKLLLKYARKALEFKVLDKAESQPNAKQINKRLSISPISVGVNIKLTSTGSNESNSSSTTTSTSPNTILSSKSSRQSISSSTPSSSFVMPAAPPSKEDWVKDDDVQECMACNTRKFTILNRRHHCRRCGRVVCSNCSQRVTLIDNVARRTCDDCYEQIELNKKRQSNQRNEPHMTSINDFKASSFESQQSKKQQQGSNLNNNSNNFSSINETKSELVYWKLLGNSENETSQRNDDEVRHLFRFQQAPSTSLCLSILDLHDQPLECGKSLLDMCDDLSNYLQAKTYQSEDISMIINMIKYLLQNAKIKLLQNSSSAMISLCDTYLSLIDILEQLLLANVSNLPSLYDLRNPESVRRVRNRLLEEERYELAMNLSTKFGLDTQSVWASWGLVELKRANYKEARTKFDKCLKQVNEKSQLSPISSTQIKILNDILMHLESALPNRMIGPQALLAQLRSVETLLSEPKLYPIGQTNMDDIQFKESLFYLETYGNYSMIISFYHKHGYLDNAMQYLIDRKCSSEIFVESLLIPCLKSGEFYRLLDNLMSAEKSQTKYYSYFSSIGKYLEKNQYLNTLYEFQLLMKDFVRASMSCICFFTRNCANYSELYENLHYLTKARDHLEKYLETSSVKEYTQSQPSNSRQPPSLSKHISTQEVDNYLNAINLQIEVTKFINNCMRLKQEVIYSYKTSTLFGNNDMKIELCCLILLCGQSVQEGFGFVIRIIQCFNLNSTLVYSQIARELAKQFNFKEIRNLLKCINESGYRNEVDTSYDECISTCIRVFAASNGQSANETEATSSAANQQQQQNNKEIEELIQLIKNDENKINAYILNGRLKSAYLIAIKIDRVDIVKHIANVAERLGQNLIKDICNKWLEKKNPI